MRMFTRGLTFTVAVLGCLVLLLGMTSSAYGQAKPKDTYILKGAPMGGVKFEHKLHQQRVANKCEVCHHPAKPEKAAKAPQESCLDCHTKPPQAGMKTGLPAAFHNPIAQAGICIDCHKQEIAKGKKSPGPGKCMECHKKENV